MSSSRQNTLKSIFQKIMAYTSFILISLVRFSTSGGQSLAILPDFLRYIIGVAEHPARLPLSIFILICNLYTNILTRITTLGRKLLLTSPSANPEKKEANEPLTRPARALLCYLKTAAKVTATSNSLNAANNAYVFWEFIFSLFKIKIPDEQWKKNTLIISFFFASLFIFTWYNLQTINEYAEKVSRNRNIRGSSRKEIAAFFSTLLLSLPCAPTFTWYTTWGPLRKLGVPDKIARYFAYVTAGAAITSIPLMTGPVYSLITKENSSTSSTKKIAYRLNKPALVTANIACAVDSIGTYGIPNFIAFVSTFLLVFNVCMKDPRLWPIAAILAIGVAIGYYIFSMRNKNGVNQTINSCCSRDIENVEDAEAEVAEDISPLINTDPPKKTEKSLLIPARKKLYLSYPYSRENDDDDEKSLRHIMSV